MNPRIALLVFAVRATGVPTSTLAAQAGGSPSFQPPKLTERELNFGVTHFRGGVASLLFQWREGLTPKWQFTLEAGLADAAGRHAGNQIHVGGALAYEMAEASADVPLDFVLTGGAYLGGGDHAVLRLPVGVSVGHTFPLDGPLSVTPYVHPRLSIISCRGCSALGVDFDVGGSLKLSHLLALRASAVFGTADAAGRDGFGISLAWTPPGLQKRTR